MKKENRLSETSWFPHDTDVITDLKISALLEDFGAEGYGIYWHIIELLHAEKNGKLPVGTLVPKAVARNMKVDAERVKVIIDACLDEYGLFIESDDLFTAERVQRNIKARLESTQVRQEAGRKGGRATQAKRKQSSSNGKAELKQTSSNAQAKSSTVQDSTYTPKRVYSTDTVSLPNKAAEPPAEALRSLVSGWPYRSPDEKVKAQALAEKVLPAWLPEIGNELNDETVEERIAYVSEVCPGGILEYLEEKTKPKPWEK